MSLLLPEPIVRPEASPRIDPPFIRSLLASLGGIPLRGPQAHAHAPPPLWHRLGDYLVDFLRLEHHARTILELHERAEAFAADRRTRTSIQATLEAPGEATRAYWRKYLASTVSRELDRAAAQVRYSRAYLYHPRLQGVVLLVNEGIPLLEAGHLESALAGAQARHEGAIALCVYHCRTPGAGEPIQGIVPQESEHACFGERFLTELNARLAQARELPPARR